LTGKPNVGQSDRWTLDVVTPEKLRTILESRELVLRQRFEALIQDVTESRDWLLRTEFAAKSAAAGAAKTASTDWLLAVERTAQNSQKDARETSGVAESILDIRDELVNNRIDTPELKRRLEVQIAAPLGEIAEKMFPDLDRLLDQMQAARDDRDASIAGREKTVAQLNLILASMQQVLGRMIELEDFNEAVELLRTIIDQQKQIDTQTQQRHKQKLHELLEK
jgi:molecular chaperone GrpE (heat shock protein)